MTVPVHNLYDFVHQVTKNKYFLLYFYPWGERAIENAIFYQIDNQWLDGPKGISIEDRSKLPLKYSAAMELDRVSLIQPTILCHDQEPLNYSLYHKDSKYVNKIFQYWQNKNGSLLLDSFKNINLRLALPYSLQKSWILLHSELNSSELKLYEDTGRFCGAYWWSHAVIARDWYRYAEYDLSLTPVSTSKKIFLSYCRDTTGSRQYRKDFLNLVSHNRISDQCQTQSFDGADHGAESSAVYNSEDFNNTTISVVLETVFDNRIHLTEKILRPIACGHPFILAAGPGSLKLLRSYGFHTFAGYINESYDDIQDAQERLAAIVSEMRRIASLPKKQFDSLIQILRSIAELNRKRFFSPEFHQQVVDELERNVAAAFFTHAGELDLDMWWQQRREKKQQLKTKLVLSPTTPLVPLYRQQRLARRITREQ
jgi:hypothetical protein